MSEASSRDLPEPQPLVARPDDVRHFAHERRAGIADVSRSGRLRLDSIARWAQDVAWEDVEDAGLRGLTVWLVRRTRIRVRRFPRLDERYRLTTYVTGVGRMWAERRTDIAAVDGERPDVEVACIWVHIDPERLLPSPIHDVEMQMWAGESTRQVTARLRHAPRPAADATARDWRFRASELDVAEHVNNAAYFTPFDDELLGPDGTRPEPPTVDLEIEYRAPAPAGDKRLLAAGPMRWVVDRDSGEVHASALLVDWPAS